MTERELIKKMKLLLECAELGKYYREKANALCEEAERILATKDRMTPLTEEQHWYLYDEFECRAGYFSDHSTLITEVERLHGIT